jgi:hypothetical protein
VNPDDRTGQDRLGQDRTKLIHGGGSAQLSSVQLSLGVMLAELGSQRVEGHSQEDAGLSLLVPGGRLCTERERERDTEREREREKERETEREKETKKQTEREQ